MMELGFENDEILLNNYKLIHQRKTEDYKRLLKISNNYNNNNISNINSNNNNNNYNSIINNKRDNNNNYYSDGDKELVSKFWDVIVITAIDQLQKEYYEQVISEKKRENQIPGFVNYIVISDPIGEKIGCGGSTLYVLNKLSEIYEGDDNLKKLKILLLHAGGYSKRLPNHSSTGKIFASIPYTLESGFKACSMLEIKLIILIDIPKRMKPGVFLACSDDIELFESKDISFDDPSHQGFIALSQPGTLDIGVGHGVFILDQLNQFKPNELNLCKKFIHKPSKEKMKLEGAILDNGLVLVDSCYYFDHYVTQLLLKYYNENKPISCEIDAYSDFLQPLGSNAEPNYFNVKSNITKFLPHLPKEREKIYSLLNSSSCKLNMIPLMPSNFIHIGTCHEYIEHFTVNFPRLGFNKIVYSVINNNSKSNRFNIESMIQDNSVIEYCSFKNIDLIIGNRCILSDLEYDSNNNNTSKNKIESITIPSNTFIHTLSLNNNRFVTILFGIDDDLKTANDPKLFGKSLKQEYSFSGKIWPNENNGNPIVESLWNASIFPISNISASDSLEKTINSILNNKNYSNVNTNTDQQQLYSIEECLNEKDLSKQFNRRKNLTNEITEFLKTK
ncbi:hypothetical protein DICPUDRAFT_82454 [Dictyostelium purpureum]|uniref:GDP-fucose pyrophosphorylase domain-containing protein n=1 Tax=Dictyostelium purpureum TaxID=5786 RepID=F0ZWK1_DICPU|nr:uncharacterized protein DICPUDRAFT_82454 [Dictyostelium purpureum]EGC31663.1 hypothetical protein DICPUDRAFT_82454 [Dictyostelium purpureum]|eukprot:XP_003291794.1 hypothetical protein DICPUDRAFT_82454 [Dictyostelium purpureum]